MGFVKGGFVCHGFFLEGGNRDRGSEGARDGEVFPVAAVDPLDSIPDRCLFGGRRHCELAGEAEGLETSLCEDLEFAPGPHRGRGGGELGGEANLEDLVGGWEVACVDHGFADSGHDSDGDSREASSLKGLLGRPVPGWSGAFRGRREV